MREIDAFDLEVYAINTGELYEAHKLLTTFPIERWVKHVRERVLPRYCREIEPVAASAKVIEAVAVALRDYYKRHMEESK
jgi:hypothetical protein